MIYYLALSICFRLSFVSFEIPYEAFGIEIATEYDERTRLRTISRVGSIIGNFAAYVMPLWVLDFFAQDPIKGWHTVGCIIGGVCFVSWFLFFDRFRKTALEYGGTKKESFLQHLAQLQADSEAKTDQIIDRL